MILKTKDISVAEQHGLPSTCKMAHREMVFTKYFSKGHSISLRPFCMTRDVPFLAEQLKKKYDFLPVSRIPFSLDLTAILCMQESDFARVYTCILDHQDPIDIAEIANARMTELGLCKEVRPGDFQFEMPYTLGKKNNHEFKEDCLQTCLEYFFSFSEIRRIISTPLSKEKGTIQLLHKNGFLYSHDLLSPYRKTFFYCNRETLRQSYKIKHYAISQ
jgi:hypothetical protein